MLSNLRKLAKMPRLVSTPLRGIKLHEYQAGALLDSYRVAIPLGEVASSVEEVGHLAKKFEGGCVVKSQVFAGGRGLGTFRENGYKGGVKVVNDADEACEVAKNMLGNHLVTKQSGEEGLQVQKLYLV